MNASSFAPKMSGTGGGLQLNISGSGFSLNTFVQIDGIDCPISLLNYSFIACIIPANVII